MLVVPTVVVGWAGSVDDAACGAGAPTTTGPLGERPSRPQLVPAIATSAKIQRTRLTLKSVVAAEIDLAGHPMTAAALGQTPPWCRGAGVVAGRGRYAEACRGLNCGGGPAVEVLCARVVVPDHLRTRTVGGSSMQGLWINARRPCQVG